MAGDSLLPRETSAVAADKAIGDRNVHVFFMGVLLMESTHFLRDPKTPSGGRGSPIRLDCIDESPLKHGGFLGGPCDCTASDGEDGFGSGTGGDIFPPSWNFSDASNYFWTSLRRRWWRGARSRSFGCVQWVNKGAPKWAAQFFRQKQGRPRD